MPNHITGEIFHQLLVTYLGTDKDKTIIKDKFTISGEKGTGKSFAYLIYDYLSNLSLISG
jgi:hypothetical protein